MTNSNNAANIALGAPAVGGAIFVAPPSATLPTDAAAALPSTFKGVGFCSEEGLKEQPTLTTKDIKEWGGGVVASPEEEYGTSYVVEFLETSALTLGLVYGEENVTGTGPTIKVIGNAKYRKEHVWIIEELIGTNRVQRTVIPRGKITNIAELTHKPNEALKYGVTIKALLDNSGNDFYRHIADVVPSGGTVG